MTPAAQFWWNWMVQMIVALATIAAVVVALFGDQLRKSLYPPKLTLRLKSKPVKTGRWIPQPGQPDRDGEAWWFHAEVSNPRRWPAVTKVRVILIQIEEEAPNGTFKRIWTRETPIQWEHPHDNPLEPDIGHPVNCDLCCLDDGGCLELFPRDGTDKVEPRWHGKTALVLTLQARGIEADSNRLRVKIAWNGGWSADPDQIGRFITLDEVA